MSHEEILKYNSKRAASKKVRGKRDKINLLNKKQIKKEKSQQIKLQTLKFMIHQTIAEISKEIYL